MAVFFRCSRSIIGIRTKLLISGTLLQRKILILRKLVSFCLFVAKKVTQIFLNLGVREISSLPCDTQRTVGITNLSKSEFQKEILLFSDYSPAAKGIVEASEKNDVGPLFSCPPLLGRTGLSESWRTPRLPNALHCRFHSLC